MKDIIMLTGYEKQLFHMCDAYFGRIFSVSGTIDQDALSLKERYQERLIPAIMIRDMGDGRIYYAMSIKEFEMEEKHDELDRFYLDGWMNAMLDAGRFLLRSVLSDMEKKAGSGFFISGPYGPGFYGEKLETMEQYLNAFSEMEEVISLKNGMLHPLKSNVGYYLRTKEMEKDQPDCGSCLSEGKNCRYCMYFQSQ